MKPVLVTPYRPTEPTRVRNWRWNRARLEALGWPIYEGDDGRHPFSRAGSRNHAAAMATAAGDWDVLVMADADVALADVSQAAAAAEMALRTGTLTYAFDVLVMLPEAESADVVSGASTLFEASVAETRHPNTWSQVLAVPRMLWDAVGGYDTRFVDWGWEDLAFMAACRTIGGGYHRASGDAYHLWHPRTRADNEDNPHHPANHALGARYLAALGSIPATRAILDERNP